MHAALGLGEAVGIFALKQHRDAFEAGRFAGQRVGDLDLPAARLGPALIHPREHLRPILRLGAARAGVDAQDAILPVVRAVQENLQFQRVEFLEKSGEVAGEFLFNLRLGFGRLGLAEFEHDAEIVELFFGFGERLDFGAERIGLFHEALRLFAVVPEIVGGHQRVDFGEPVLQCGHVKETSAGAKVSPRPWQFPF